MILYHGSSNLMVVLPADTLLVKTISEARIQGVNYKKEAIISVISPYKDKKLVFKDSASVPLSAPLYIYEVDVPENKYSKDIRESIYAMTDIYKLEDDTPASIEAFHFDWRNIVEWRVDLNIKVPKYNAPVV